tara:strand:+ start:1165 stop:1569 length:405 start_codon:yes stop_codon:yes gene_type:complete
MADVKIIAFKNENKFSYVMADENGVAQSIIPETSTVQFPATISNLTNWEIKNFRTDCIDFDESKKTATWNKTNFENIVGSEPSADALALNLVHQARRIEYPYIGDQLDDLFKQGAFSSDMSAKIKAVKDKHPKP